MSSELVRQRRDAVERRAVDGGTPEARGTPALFAILLVALVVRVGAAVAFPNVDASDAATREAAHRVAYGYGLLNLDWQQGLRSWVFPALLAGAMRATDWMGAGSGGYLSGLALILSLVSLTTVLFSYGWAYRAGGAVAGLVAASASAVWYEMVYYAPKAMYEVAAGHVLLPGLYLATFDTGMPERRRLFIAGALLGLAVALRPPLVPTVILVVIAACLRNPRLRVPATAAGLLGPILLFGVVDAITWSYPFQSFYSFFRFNIVQHSGAQSGSPWFVEHEWIRPWYWFVPVLGLRLGPMVLFALVGLRRSPFLGWIALSILLTHSVVGHKEFRFVYPMIPIMLTLGGLGVVEVVSTGSSRWRSWRSPLGVYAVSVVICIASSAVLAAFFPLWTRYSGNLIAAQELSRDPAVCGVALVGSSVDPVNGGGYAYLHKNIPIYFFRGWDTRDVGRLTSSFNALVTALPSNYAGFQLMRCWNGTCLYRKPGPCTPSPADRVKVLPVE